MTAPRTFPAVLGVALAAVAAWLALAPWVPEDLLTLAREVGREEALARRLAAAQQFSEGKHQTAAEMIAGRITLPEAAARFRELNSLVEGDGQDGTAPFLLARGEEALWRNVLHWVEAELYHRRGRPGLLARRRKYLAAHRANGPCGCRCCAAARGVQRR
jgi:hypothetical protein